MVVVSFSASFLVRDACRGNASTRFRKRVESITKRPPRGQSNLVGIAPFSASLLPKAMLMRLGTTSVRWCVLGSVHNAKFLGRRE